MIPPRKPDQNMTEWGFEHYRLSPYIPPHLKPARLVHGKLAVAMGTLVVFDDSKPDRFITAAHCFPVTEEPKPFSCFKFNSHGHKRLRRLGAPTPVIDEAGYDYPVSCLLDEDSTYKAGITLDETPTNIETTYQALRPNITVRLVLNGSRIRLKEKVMVPGHRDCYLCEEPADPSMSGSGAVDSDGNLYVLAHVVPSSKRRNYPVSLWFEAGKIAI